jgi:hypothetical protein
MLETKEHVKYIASLLCGTSLMTLSFSHEYLKRNFVFLLDFWMTGNMQICSTAFAGVTVSVYFMEIHRVDLFGQ